MLRNNLRSTVFCCLILFDSQVTSVSAAGLDCLSPEQRTEYDRRFQQLMIESDRKMLDTGIRERYLVIEKQRFALLEAYVKCSNSSKPEDKERVDACAPVREKLMALEEKERKLKAEISSKDIISQVNEMIADEARLRNEYPPCNN